MTSQQQISSNWTAFHKKLAALWFPAFFGFLGTVPFLKGEPPHSLFQFLFLFAMLVGGLVLGVHVRRLLADVVLDCSDFLRVTRNGQQQDIPFAEIVAVEYVHPPQYLNIFKHDASLYFLPIAPIKIKQKHGADLYFLPNFSITLKSLIDRAAAANRRAGGFSS
jgi:hypothetical protein